jgi:hypothetical protein
LPREFAQGAAERLSGDIEFNPLIADLLDVLRERRFGSGGAHRAENESGCQLSPAVIPLGGLALHGFPLRS